MRYSSASRIPFLTCVASALVMAIVPAVVGQERIPATNGIIDRTVTGRLSNGREKQFVFEGRKGQTVTIRNKATHLFDYRVYNEAEDFETEFDSSPSLSFQLPADGDYQLFVRKKMVKRPVVAAFVLTISVR